jgi:hypothetical protein
VARWEDSSLVGRDILLPPVLETALGRHELSPAQVVALFTLLKEASLDLITRVVEEAGNWANRADLSTLQEELARHELLHFGRGARVEVYERLKTLSTGGDHGTWLDRLARAATFHRTAKAASPEPVRVVRVRPRSDGTPASGPNPLDTIDWQAHRFVTLDEINDVIDRANAGERGSSPYVGGRATLARIAEEVAPGDRVRHLDALVAGEVHRVFEGDLTAAILQRVDAWGQSPAVHRWCRERLVPALVAGLPRFSRGLSLGWSSLPELLERSGAAEPEICDALLEAMERHVEALGVSTILALTGLIGRHCTPDDVARTMARYAERLVGRIPTADRDEWSLADLPWEPADGLARFLYALLSDVDIGVRWRAAHVLRGLARLGETGTIDNVVGLYGRTAEPSYRTPDGPFYWPAARLWLVLVLRPSYSDGLRVG